MRSLVALLVLAMSASAQEGGRDTAPDVPPKPKPIEVYCTDGQGDRHELGDVICITASCATWMARCEMSLNNVIWRKTQDGCPGVSLDERLRRLSPASRGVAPAMSPRAHG